MINDDGPIWSAICAVTSWFSPNLPSLTTSYEGNWVTV